MRCFEFGVLEYWSVEITRENTGDLNATITVKIVPEDYRDQVKNVLKDYAKKANIKGFRPGKVPVSVVRKMYGQAVVLEELNKVRNLTHAHTLLSLSLPLSVYLHGDAESSQAFPTS